MTEAMTPETFRERLVFHVKHEAIDDLSAFLDHLTAQNEVMNLVGPATIPHFWSRHVLDSAQLLDRQPDARLWADLGAGAGFPGLVLAILLKHSDLPDPRIYLIDSLAKRCRFLQSLVDDLKLPATVINDRAENIDLKVDVITARAFAPFPKLFQFAERFFKNGAEGWFLKGENVESELAEAGKHWRFEVDQYESLSDPRGRVVHIRRLKRAR
ncbi:16S rRNA (guanine(527)-N(7))-methyltransferase RsmG [Asticcacaulis solisilvae]|uniref:16S rRNA (guanine(527)-N(7))-methyltransferase RsmG n=1 Tax=Asticcacaulis solisilvae TaxID=1217274 RepID=UPI003FD78539